MKQVLANMSNEQVQQLKDALYMIADANQMLLSLKNELKAENNNLAESNIAQISKTVNEVCSDGLGCIGEFLRIL